MVDQSFIGGSMVTGLLALAGALAFLAVLAGLVFGRVRGQSNAFMGANLAAALLLLPGLTAAFGGAGAAGAGVWAALAAAGLFSLHRAHMRMAIGADEAPVVEALVPGLPNDRARALLSLGQWNDFSAGTELTVEGEPTRWLAYLAEGYCLVERAEERVATLGSGSLIGEMTFFSAAPATATVRTVGRTRIFVFETKQLRRFLAEEEDIRAALEHNILTVLGLRLRETTGDVARLKRLFEQAGLSDRRQRGRKH